MALHEQLNLLFERRHEGIKPGLRLTEELAQALGRPQDAFAAIHVAGSNGKGSVCAILERLFRELGLVTGLFTSPHLVRFNERIRINGVPIDDDLLAGVLAERESIEKTLSRLPTFFECATTMAFSAFKRAGVQVAIIETGLGGRLDSTNILTPLLSVITPISMDHMAFLGDTLEKIAGEKAGIIKPGRPVIVAPQRPEAEKVLSVRATACNASLIPADQAAEVRRKSVSLDGQRVQLISDHRKVGPFTFPLLGKHQLVNLLTAFATFEVAEQLLGMETPEQTIVNALETVDWGGRLEVVSSSPARMIDVAHNQAGASSLVDSLRDIFGKKTKGHFIVGCMADKDLDGILAALKPVCARMTCVGMSTLRALSATAIANRAGMHGISAEIGDLNVFEQNNDEAFTVLCGSVYLVGEYLARGQGTEPQERG